VRDAAPAGIRDSLLNPLSIYLLAMVLLPWTAAPLLRRVIGAAAGVSGEVQHAAVSGFVVVLQGFALIALTLAHVLGPRGLGLSPRALGLSGRGWQDAVRLGVAGGLVLVIINIAGSRAAAALFRVLLGQDGLTRQLARERAVITELFQLDLPGALLALLLFGSVVIAPLSEELFFRGYLHAVLRERFGASAAYVSGALFAAAHMYLVHFLPLAVMGVVLARIYERRGTLVAPVVAHGLANLVVAASLLLARGVSPS